MRIGDYGDAMRRFGDVAYDINNSGRYGNDCEGDAVFQIEELYEGLFAEGI